MKRSRESNGKQEDGDGMPKEEKAVAETKLAAPPKDRTAKASMRRRDKASRMAHNSSKTFTMEESEIAALNVSFCHLFASSLFFR